MKNILLVVGSQSLYGPEVLAQVEKDAKTIAHFLSEKLKDTVEIHPSQIVTSSDDALSVIEGASLDQDCVAIITWMHTFSPAKMWIKGLQRLNKPLLHLHTQINEKIPYQTIDMNFMNLNQAAHGDREYAFILKRLNISHQIVVGYYQHQEVVNQIRQFAEVAIAIDASKNLKCATFGNNMREVAVTDGDRVESHIHFGWESNYFALGDLVNLISKVEINDIKIKMHEYQEKYLIKSDDIKAIEEQAKYDVALHQFLKQNDINAITDTFQDLHGLKQLPGLAVQNLMSEGIGFGPEGDYKISCLSYVLEKMSMNRKGATGFVEDYTYDLSKGQELELGSHMLEVSPVFAKNKPSIEVHPLGIGGKENPARLVFDGVSGRGIQVTLIDLGTHFRLIAMEVELVEPKAMPKLPVARLMWKILPSFEEGLKFWLENGGGHHSVISTALSIDDISLFAKLTNTEFVCLKANK